MIEKAMWLREEDSGPFKLSATLHDRAMSYFVASGEAERAEYFIEQKHMRYQAQQSLPPTASDFNQVLEAWANSSAPRAAERADAIMQHMHILDGVKLKDMKPNIRSYEQLLRVWKKSALPMASERANELRDELQEMRGDNDSASS